MRRTRYHSQLERRARERHRLCAQSNVEEIASDPPNAVMSTMYFMQLTMGLLRAWLDATECKSNPAGIGREFVRERVAAVRQTALR